MEDQDKPNPRPLALEPYIIAYFGDLLKYFEQEVQRISIQSISEQSPDDQ